MSCPQAPSVTRCPSLSSVVKSRPNRARSRNVKSAFIGYELPSRFATLGEGFGDSMSASFSQQPVYSPPPSPTLNSYVNRFESPYPSYIGGDTPSLLNESLPSTISSPSLAHTPMPYTTTRDPRSDSSALVGLGISGLLMHDGSVFDGMGALPRRDKASELGFFMDEADDECGWNDGEARRYPEHEEDDWRKRLSTHGLHAYLDQLKEPAADLSQGSIIWSPPASSSPCKPSKVASASHPVEPETDDVFFTRSPAAMSPLSNSMRRQEISRAMVSSWFRSVQSSEMEHIEEGLRML
ncbi:hypothetical protein PHLCEN_2v11616 [Hermanssonia centrifuga]|uniref:Uncharacterized protein n=1 Tax=Hermanssonia centrifuga TaxID=98765 RepID=A0A2R6NJI3_9APHY|nr:hypothetical protein PHLCEN_2v11616 [Hermanssonia centrifuga]